MKIAELERDFLPDQVDSFPPKVSSSSGRIAFRLDKVQITKYTVTPMSILCTGGGFYPLFMAIVLWL